MNNIEQQALEYAAGAHASVNQHRKYSGLPYIVHPQAVANILKKAGERDPAIIAASYMHDVLEDVTPLNPDYSAQSIEDLFGHRILLLVKELTDEYTPTKHPTLNRGMRKTMEAMRLSNVSFGAIKIKLADLIDNTSDIAKHDKGFAQVYIQEKERILEGMSTKIGLSTDPVLTKLYHMALAQLHKHMEALGSS